MDFLLASCVQGGSCPDGQGSVGFRHAWYMNRLCWYPKTGMAHEGTIPAAHGQHVSQVAQKRDVLPFSAEIPGSCPPGMPPGVGSERVCEEVTPCSWQPCSFPGTSCVQWDIWLQNGYFSCALGLGTGLFMPESGADTRRADPRSM